MTVSCDPQARPLELLSVRSGAGGRMGALPGSEALAAGALTARHDGSAARVDVGGARSAYELRPFGGSLPASTGYGCSSSIGYGCASRWLSSFSRLACATQTTLSAAP